MDILIHTEINEQVENGKTSSSSSCFQLANNKTLYIRKEMYPSRRPCWKSSISGGEQRRLNVDISEQNQSVGQNKQHAEEKALSSSQDQWQDFFLPVCVFLSRSKNSELCSSASAVHLAFLRVYASFNEFQPVWPS